MGGHWKKEQEKAESQAPQICRYARARARTRGAAAALPEEHGDEAEEARAEGEAEPEKARVEREANPPAPLPKTCRRALCSRLASPQSATRALLHFFPSRRMHAGTAALSLAHLPQLRLLRCFLPLACSRSLCC